MDDLILRIENISKHYILGQIGGTTMREELQRLGAKLCHQEDPTMKIMERDFQYGETFLALDGISFDVKKGERVGIIGHNGAGKSTLLKLISRITAPTSGRIGLNGRVASMLEVGTGFHGELTGRENMYMNGAILGMKKKEIDSKIEDIIEFSECRQFIDTPVKRYSSGMYVKLAFAVAAHLDAEIMIMDEVLAVGDMKFQKKCLEKMSDVSHEEGRTILYVSHNMHTIRQLCERCIVLDHGKIVFDGDVEEAIEVYMGINNTSESVVDLSALPREKHFKNPNVLMSRLKIDTETSCFGLNERISGELTVNSKLEYDKCVLKIFLICNGVPIMTSESGSVITLKQTDDNQIQFRLALGNLAPGKYNIKLVLGQRNEFGGIDYLDVLMDCYIFEIAVPDNFHDNQKWDTRYNGYVIGEQIEIMNSKTIMT